MIIYISYPSTFIYPTDKQQRIKALIIYISNLLK
jgi:hypothetical protein